jgi:hypothetical protein
MHEYYCTVLWQVKKVKSKAVPLHAMEALGGEEVYLLLIHELGTLDWGERSASRPGRAFTPGKRTPREEAGWAPI